MDNLYAVLPIRVGTWLHLCSPTELAADAASSRDTFVRTLGSVDYVACRRRCILATRSLV